MERKASILIVEDQPSNLNILTDQLRKAGFRIRVALSGEVALESIEIEEPDLILMDIGLPGIDGYETCSRIKEKEKFLDLPVIFITAMEGILNKTKAFDSGAVDYIEKPFNIDEVNLRINKQLELYNYQRHLKDMNFELFRQYQFMFQHSPIAIVYADSKNLMILKYNRSFKSLFDITSDTTEIRSLNELFQPDSLKVFNTIVKQVNDGTVVDTTIDIKALTASGEKKILKMNIFLMEDQEVQSNYLVINFDDISDHILLQEEQSQRVKLSEEVLTHILDALLIEGSDLKQVLDSLPEIAAVLNKDGTLLLHNTKLGAILDLKPDDSVIDFRSFLMEEQVDQFDEALRQVNLGNKTYLFTELKTFEHKYKIFKILLLKVSNGKIVLIGCGINTE